MIKVPWTEKPPLGVDLDWDNDLNRDLIGEWPFNDRAGGTAKNLADPTGDTNGVWNISGDHWRWDVANFNNSNYIEIAASILASAIGTWSISLRFSLDVYAEDDILISGNKPGSNAGDWQFNLRGDHGIRLFYNNGIFFDTPANSISTITWHDLVATQDGDDAIIYIDGVRIVSDPRSGVIGGNGQNVRIGIQSTGAGALDGQIDYVSMWSRALSEAEVKAMSRNPWQRYQPQIIPFVAAVVPDVFVPQVIMI